MKWVNIEKNRKSFIKLPEKREYWSLFLVLVFSAKKGLYPECFPGDFWNFSNPDFQVLSKTACDINIVIRSH